MGAKQIKTVIGWSIAGALAGGLLGLAMGILLPDYYMGVFGLSPSRRGEAPSIGLGLGLSQGLIVGAIAGVLVVAVDRFRPNGPQPLSSRSDESPPTFRFIPALVVLNLVLSLVIILGVLAFGILNGISSGGRTPDTSWVGDKIYLHNISRETLLVTHLAVGQGPRGHVMAYAPLDPPLLLTMKQRPQIDPKSLHWRDPIGEAIEPPAPGTPVTALFVVPEQALYSESK